MMTFEKKIAEFFEKNVLTIAFATGLIVSLLIRLSAYSFISSDMSGFLIGWFGQIEQLGRFKALSVQVGNYSVAYQTLIALMTYIPVDPVYQYKTLSVIFDYSLALGVYFLVFELKNHDRKIALLSFLAVVFSPLVFMNSGLFTFSLKRNIPYPLSFTVSHALSNFRRCSFCPSFCSRMSEKRISRFSISF